MRKIILIYAFVFVFLFASGECYGEIHENLQGIKEVSDRVCREHNALTDEDKIIVLSHYVYTKLKPDPTKGISPHAGMSTLDRLSSGVGWCNHQIAVFMRLCEAQGIKTRMLYLLNNEGTASPHTIGEAYLDDRWVLIDAQNDLNLRNKNGELISLRDIYRDPSILRKNEELNKMTDEWLDCFLNPAIYVYGLE